MTEEFDNFITSLLYENTFNDVSSNDYNDLPNSRPYGFWVFKDGRFTPVLSYGHEKRADHIIKHIPELSKEYEEWSRLSHEYSAQHFFYIKGIAKITLDGPLLYWTNPKWIRTDFTLTTSQQRTIKNIAAHYKLEINRSN